MTQFPLHFEIFDVTIFCKNTTYFVGDGDTDVLAGLRAGVKLIAVTYGYRDKDVLASLGAKVFADSPEEILDIIFGDDTNE